MPSQVSAEAVAVATLHCVICFDEFNLNDQTPVVLPCGHTYVCASCSKRLKVCMECREPLFWIPPRAPLPPPLQQQRLAHRGYNGTRYNSLAPASQNKSPIRESVEPIPLPLPRNLVLLAIMEAAQRAKMLQGEINEGDQEDGELSRIMLSLEKMNGTCGTYAVKDMEGLAVLPLDPRKRHPRRPNSYLDTTMNNSNLNEPYTIQWGQTLQIVDVQDGVYRLARECGYVVASATQLVKIGGPLDKSCELEGIYDILELRKLKIRRKIEEVERLSASIQERIQFEQTQEPSYPILTLAPQPPQLEDVVASPQSPDRGLASEDSLIPITPRSYSTTPVNSYLQSRTPNTIDNSDLDVTAFVDENVRFRSIEFGCGLSFPLGGDERNSGRSFDSVDTRARLISNSATSIPQSMGQPDLAAAPSSSSFDAVDFRTGLSGHRGLGSTKTPDRRNMGSTRGNIRMMGEHRGIGTWPTPFSLSNMLGSLHPHEETATPGSSSPASDTPRNNIHKRKDATSGIFLQL